MRITAIEMDGDRYEIAEDRCCECEMPKNGAFTRFCGSCSLQPGECYKLVAPQPVKFRHIFTATTIAGLVRELRWRVEHHTECRVHSVENAKHDLAILERLGLCDMPTTRMEKKGGESNG